MEGKIGRNHLDIFLDLRFSTQDCQVNLKLNKSGVSDKQMYIICQSIMEFLIYSFAFHESSKVFQPRISGIGDENYAFLCTCIITYSYNENNIPDFINENQDSFNFFIKMSKWIFTSTQSFHKVQKNIKRCFFFLNCCSTF